MIDESHEWKYKLSVYYVAMCRIKVGRSIEYANLYVVMIVIQ